MNRGAETLAQSTHQPVRSGAQKKRAPKGPRTSLVNDEETTSPVDALPDGTAPHQECAKTGQPETGAVTRMRRMIRAGT